MAKREWIVNFIFGEVLKEQACCYTNIMKMCEAASECDSHGLLCCIPGNLHLGMTGFSCKDMSKLNPMHKERWECFVFCEASEFESACFLFRMSQSR